jgi:hypothetical protein
VLAAPSIGGVRQVSQPVRLGDVGDDDGPQIDLYPPTLHDPDGDTVAAFMLAGGWVGGVVFGGLFASGTLGLVVGGAAALAGAGMIAFPWQRLRLRNRAVRRRVARARRAAASPTPVAKMSDERVQVRGRVHVLRGARLSGEPCAAYCASRPVRTRCTCTPLCTSTYDALEVRWECGRFAVVDDSGVAVVDGATLTTGGRPAIDIHPRDDRPALEDEPLVLRHGDEVCVFGRAREMEASDASALSPSTYRDRRRPLVFQPDGEPVLILL